MRVRTHTAACLQVVGLAGSIATLVAARPAMTQAELGLSGGYFLPQEGGAHGGPTAQIQLVGALTDEVRFGAEVEYRKSRNELFGVEDIDIHGIGVHALVSYVFWPDAPITPYAGVGVGLGANFVDYDKIEDEREAELLRRPGVVAADVDVTPLGFSVGAFALLGLQVPVAESVRLFAEARYGGDWQLTGQVESETNTGSRETDEADVENLGGFSGIGGIRFVF